MATFEGIVAGDVWVSTGLKVATPITSAAEYKEVIGWTLGAALLNGAMMAHEVPPALDGAVVVRFTARRPHGRA